MSEYEAYWLTDVEEIQLAMDHHYWKQWTCKHYSLSIVMPIISLEWMAGRLWCVCYVWRHERYCDTFPTMGQNWIVPTKFLSCTERIYHILTSKRTFLTKLNVDICCKIFLPVSIIRWWIQYGCKQHRYTEWMVCIHTSSLYLCQ